MDKFTTIMPFILEMEGGYSNDKVDPGGETKWGISDRRDGLKDGLVDAKIPVKELTLQQAYDIYKREYWDKCGAEGMEFPLAACMMDTAVNMGVSKAVRFLKESEGHWGKYLEARTVSYFNIIKHNPSLKKYQNGWLNRINKLKTFILAHKNDFE